MNQGEHLLRLPEVLKRIPVSKSHWWDGVSKGLFPQGLKLSPRCTVWRSSDIDALIESLREL
nr:AlpA family phage regulatory protein [Pseudodesulfovibrio sp. zrk46]